MGYVSKVPYPSPLQLLAIISAHGNGVAAHAIHRRTGYSNSTIARWTKQWGHDAAVFEEWVRKYRINLSGYRYEDLWPKQRDLEPKGYRCAPVEEPNKFIVEHGLRK